ncbi:MAG: hypothetical protein JWO40_808 [Candidatus Doudnabacteria bacterium]|nr:hypothetical protein [Candidatus Doudnabacteria bacterium]
MQKLKILQNKKRLQRLVSLLVAIAVFGFILLDWHYFQGLLISPKQSSAQLEAAAEKGPVNTLFIPELHLQAPVRYPITSSEIIFQKELQSGVVHYPGTALPGQPGSVYIFGHSSDYLWTAGNYKNVFSRLPQLPVGANITLTDATGKTFKYTVTRKEVVAATDTAVLKQNPDNHQLILQTSYPLGTALKRYLVFAELSQ